MRISLVSICVLFLLFNIIDGGKHQKKKTGYHKRAVSKENVFVRLHIQNPEIVKRVTSIQKKLGKKSGQLKKYFQMPQSVHITILVTAIDNENAQDAIEALEEAVCKFKEDYLSNKDEFKLKFKGLQSFGKRVLIGTVENEHKLRALNEIAMQEFEEHGLVAQHSVGHSVDFHPHMSIVNIKDKSSEKLGSKWSNMLDKNMRFGTETVKSVQLVWFGVNKEKKDYNVIHEVEL